MQDVLSRLRQLNRPRLLVRAARIGVQSYRRERDLRPLLGFGNLPRPVQALTRLIELEQIANARRRSGDATYVLTSHVALLIALMGEAQLLQDTQKT